LTGNPSGTFEMDDMVNSKPSTHVEEVRTFFEAPDGYFARRGFDIRIRAETVAGFLRNSPCAQVLDVGCGDGSISLPLLDRSTVHKLTLIDVSRGMLQRARQGVSARHQQNVEFVNEDFLTWDAEGQAFDVILCMGVMAHVSSPKAVAEKMISVLRPGGSVLLEITDSYHIVGKLLVWYHQFLELFRPAPYRLNKLRIDEVLSLFVRHGLELRSIFRYALPPPGSQRFLSHESLYRMTRLVFGPTEANRLPTLGNIGLFRLVKV
jgi:2-polyprenyl-3-methyl-5-hydroxy-6-metoxy-1,4-benzoquinol methylase